MMVVQEQVVINLSDTFYIKQNDSAPNIKAQLKDAADNNINLSAAEAVYFHMENKTTMELYLEKEAEIVNAENGIVIYNWDRGDTSEHGTYICEWMVDWGNDIVETFPNDDYNEVVITRQIAGVYEE